MASRMRGGRRNRNFVDNSQALEVLAAVSMHGRRLGSYEDGLRGSQGNQFDTCRLGLGSADGSYNKYTQIWSQYMCRERGSYTCRHLFFAADYTLADLA